MRVTCIQLEIKERPKLETLNHVLRLLGESGENDLILLPELWPIGYFSFERYESESESMDGPIMTAIRQKAAALKSHILMGSFVEKDGEHLFNTAVLFDSQGEIVAKYRKIHLFGYQSEERRLLRPGEALSVSDLPWGNGGISTCYDLRFPELFRKMVNRGTSFFMIPSAWPLERLETLTLFNRVRAHENLAYLFSCNGAGVSAGTKLAGHSMIVDPLGKVIAEGGEGECFVSADIDPFFVDTVRKEFRVLDDRVFF
jgi:predicted amidohydrolase